MGLFVLFPAGMVILSNVFSFFFFDLGFVPLVGVGECAQECLVMISFFMLLFFALICGVNGSLVWT